MAYYEQQCSREGKEVYRAILRGASAMENEIRVVGLPVGEISDIYTRLRLDHPEIFFLTGFRVRAVPGAEYAVLLPEYMFGKEKTAEHKKAIGVRVERLVRDIRTKSEKDRFLFLHRFITEHVHYDKLEKNYSHEIIGPLTQGVGVCEGIAKTVKLLADALGLECIVALSAPEEGKRYGHTWNIVKRGGRWYHMDTTYDLGLKSCGTERWDYFMLADAQIYRDHNRPLYPVPECSDSGAFYYKEQRLSFTRQEDLAKRITQAARKKSDLFVFHWRGGYLTKDTLNTLLTLIPSAAAAADRSVQISLNWPQSVFCLHFSSGPAGTDQVTMEKADESGT